MKKTAVWILVCICLLGVVGCGTETKENGKPEQENAVVSVFYIADGKETPLQISSVGAAEIEKQVNNAVWINDIGKCLEEYKVVTADKILYYHADCGTFNDKAAGRNFTLKEEQKRKINQILKSEKAE